MRVSSFIALLASASASMASAIPYAAMEEPPSRVVEARQAVVTPPPCVAISPLPSDAETQARFQIFGDAFLVQKNLTRAFEYISSTYKNHNPWADDGPGPALDFLGPVWPSIQITPRRRAFKPPMSWLEYDASGIGRVVDRFRWEAGCIVEHWDQGEVFPPN